MLAPGRAASARQKNAKNEDTGDAVRRMEDGDAATATAGGGGRSVCLPELRGTFCRAASARGAREMQAQGIGGRGGARRAAHSLAGLAGGAGQAARGGEKNGTGGEAEEVAAEEEDVRDAPGGAEPEEQCVAAEEGENQ
jgi:hypothetical protein